MLLIIVDLGVLEGSIVQLFFILAMRGKKNPVMCENVGLIFSESCRSHNKFLTSKLRHGNREHPEWLAGV